MKKLFVAILALAFLAACSSEPSKPAPAEKPKPKAPEAITGESALYKCYVPARGWAPDAQPFRVESEITGRLQRAATARPDRGGSDSRPRRNIA